MWVVIDGAAGSGKTWLQTKLVRREWRAGENVFANYDLYFSEKNEDIYRFYSLDETYNLTHGVIAFDELQDLAGYWNAMPISFRNKIAHHRHHKLTIYSNTQDFKDLHTELRRNVHVRYRCSSILRLPISEAKMPIFQWIKVTKRVKVSSSHDNEPRFEKIGRTKSYFLSKYWTKSYYNTHANIDFTKYLCKLIYEKKMPNQAGIWRLKMVDRDMISQGKARL
jgi:hypothetical protein